MSPTARCVAVTRRGARFRPRVRRVVAPAVLTESAARGDLQAAAGDRDGAYELAALLRREGRVAEQRARADAGDWFSASHLAELLAELGEETELRERADAGDRSSANSLAYLLATQGRVDDLRTELAAGNPAAADRLRQLGHDPRSAT